MIWLVFAWTVLGALVGAVVAWSTPRLERLEGLEASAPSRRNFQRWGPVALVAVFYLAFSLKLGFGLPLWLDSLWAAVLTQVIFFDLRHHLILDRVLLPAYVLALIAAFFVPHLGVVTALIAAVVAGGAFLLLALVGRAIFKADALGLGDVKFAVLMGLILGAGTFDAVLIGMVLAGVASIAVIASRRRGLRDSIAYGPFLALGTIVVLYQLGGG